MMMGERAGTSRETIEEMIKSFEWYQRIPLGNGMVTPGEDGYSEAKLKMIQLPEDLSGKSVLDIGCCEGFFAFEAERRGASHILAIDMSDKVRKKFELLKRFFNSKVKFILLNVTDLDTKAVGRFDLVFLLSVFHHLRHPFLALDRIASVTAGLAIMEVPVAIPRSFTECLDDEPMMLRRISKRGRLRFVPNIPFLTEILNGAGFGKVEILKIHRGRRIPGYGGRYVEQRAILKAFKKA